MIQKYQKYYSHYKADKSNVLNFTQICNSINVLKALITMIMFNHIGMEKSMIKNAITNDGELSFQTICLRESKALDSENSE